MKNISKALFALLFSVFLTLPQGAKASLIGPWFRYSRQDLGFQMPISTGWSATPVPDGVVIAMQAQPDPYVRVAVGRITGPTVESVIQEELRRSAPGSRRTACRIDGQDAIQIEGNRPQGAFMDVFVQKGTYWYWIGFAADQKELWPQYRKTFDIVLDGFHFL
jgi:hypothetical protein